MSDDSETQLINLAAIQRVDASITNIIDNSTQTALYKFDELSMKWEKTEIEGTFFIYKRTQSPHFGYIILNRLNTTNKVEPVTDITDTDLQVPYLMYQCKSGDIYGIWFYDEEDCVRISKQIARYVHASAMTRNRRQRCVSESDSRSPIRQKNGPSSNTDIIAILTNAQMKFNQRKSAVRALRSVPSLEDDNGTDSLSANVNGSFLKGCSPHVNSSSVSVSLKKRFPSSGTLGSKSSCSKQLFETSSEDVPSLSPATSVHREARHQFMKSRTLSLDSTPRRSISHNFLDEEPAVDAEDNSKLIKLVASSFTSSENKIPEETSMPVMTPEMFEQSADSSYSLKETPNFGPRNMPVFQSDANWKDHQISEAHQVVSSSPFSRTSSKLVYSPQDFQNTSGNIQDGLLISDESEISAEGVLPPTDSQAISKVHLANSLVHLLANDSSMLLKIHEAYILSLKSHLSNFKK